MAYSDLFEQAQGLTEVGSMPWSSSQPSPATAKPAGRQPRTTLSPTSGHRLVPATHTSLLLDATDVTFSISAIEDVVQAARTGTVVANS